MTTRASPAGRIPLAVAVVGGVALAWLGLTLVGLLARVPWARLGEVAARPEFREALSLSLRTCLGATLVVLLMGLPLAIWIGNSGRLAPLMRALVLTPLALPPVVAGLALLSTFGRRGLLGTTLSGMGIEIGFTTIAVLMAQVFVSLPYFVVSVEAALRVHDPGPGRALALLGAGPGMVLRHATLPALTPAISSGLALAFARALGEFGATLTFAGSLQGTTRTMPLAIYLARESDPDVAYALALVLIATALAAIALAEGVRRWILRPRPGPAGTADPATPEPDEERPPAQTVAAAGEGRRRDGDAHRREGEDRRRNGDAHGREGEGRRRDGDVHGREGEGRRGDGGETEVEVDRPDRGVRARLRIGEGEVLALIGPNGAGKTTVLETVARDHPARTAVLSQDPALLPHLSALQNVALGPALRGIPAHRARAIAQQVLDEVGASALGSRRPGEMSGGQRARVALARALAVEPDVLLLDEPTAALDVTSASEIRALLEGVLPGRRAIIASHDVLDLQLASRVVVLEAGRIVEDASLPDLLTAPESDFAQEFVGVNRLRGEVVVGSAGAWVEVAGDPVMALGAEEDGTGPGAVLLYFGTLARLVENAGPGKPDASGGGVQGAAGGSADRAGALRVRGTVRSMAPTLGSVRLTLGLADGQECRVVVSASEAAGTAPGERVGAEVRAPRVLRR
ncbi:MAG TPA: ATP-binding cassette domain-containing protein [Actinomycetales bacterium]|nr:ATP-binding cassette domain-containing protein [Actinomycetales bacterium]